TYKVQDNQIKIVEDFDFAAPKTKEFVNFAKNLQAEGKKILVVLPSQNKNVYLSARNVPNAQIITACDVNTYAIMNSSAIILTEGSLDVINKL
ncbi:MAG: 50S ribosomal protein L4, partial [Paramuribaculum sp.]|nr:50S ribosomal protein L4 [Paramuribaculum sp.]